TGQLRPEARHRLTRDRAILLVAHFVGDGDQLARMHLDIRLLRLEVPRQVVRVRIELDGDLAGVVDLRIYRFAVAFDYAAIAVDFTNLLVEGHEHEAEAEHHAGNDQ